MEGLIPFICRAIKRNKNSSSYTSLSSSTADAAKELSMAPLPENHAAHEFEMAKFDGGSNRRQLFVTPPPEGLSGFVVDAADEEEEAAVFRGRRLRSYASLHEFPGGGLASPPQKRLGGGGRGPAKFLRARSHRVLACVNGGFK